MYDVVIQQIAQAVQLFASQATAATVEAALKQSPLTEVFLANDGGEGFLAICEQETLSAVEGSAAAASVIEVVVTTRLRSVADQHIPTCVVLTHKRPEARSATITHAAVAGEEASPSTVSSPATQTQPLLPMPAASIRDLHVQTLTLSSPLEDLHTSLTTLYEPLCHPRDTILRGQIHDLVSAIRSKNSTLTDFKITRYIHSELLAICQANPSSDVNQLFEALGSQKTGDITFLKDVQQVRNKVVPALEVDSLMFSRSVTSYRDEVAYWNTVLAWLEDVHMQLQSREWKLVHRVLGHRVASSTSNEGQFSNKVHLVKEFIQILQTIPYNELAAARDDRTLFGVVVQIFDELSSQSKYPEHRAVLLMDSLVSDLVEQVLSFCQKKSSVFAENAAEEVIPFLHSAKNVLSEVRQRRTQTYERLKKQTPEAHPKCAAALNRISRVQNILHEHMSFHDNLKRAFAADPQNRAFIDQLEHAQSEFSATMPSDTNLWDITEQGLQRFDVALSTYEKAAGQVEERVALLVKSMLSGSPNGQEMFAIHSQFRHFKRAKIRATLREFQVPLFEMISTGIKEIQSRHFDETNKQRAARVFMANGLSPIVGLVLYENSISVTISQYLVKLDSISEYGWQDLVALQSKIGGGRWRLTAQLAQYFGVGLHELTSSDAVVDSDVYGTAFALAYLDQMFGDDRGEWDKNPHIIAARVYLMKTKPEALQSAKGSLANLRIGQVSAAERERTREARSSRTTILRIMEQKIQQWCNQVVKRIHDLSPDPDTMTITKTIYPTTLTTNRKGAPELTTTLSPEWDMYANDLKHLTSQGLFENDSEVKSTILTFFRNNEHAFADAMILRENLSILNGLMAHDDGTLSLLLAEEYRAVRTLLLQGAALRWREAVNVTNHVQDLSEAMCVLATSEVDIRDAIISINEIIEKLGEEICTPQEIRHRVMELRKHINRISLKSINATKWVQKVQIEGRLETALLFQLEHLISAWTTQFQALATDPKFLEENYSSGEPFHLQPLRVRMRVVQRKIFFETNASEWRTHWYSEFNKALSWLGELPLLVDRQNRLNVGVSIENFQTARNGYHRLLDQLPPSLLQEAYHAIEDTIAKAVATEQEWQGSQRFLGLDLAAVHHRLGESLKQWLAALQQIRQFSQRQMDGTQPYKVVGGILILSEEAQQELRSKFHHMNHYLNVKFQEIAEQQFDLSYRSITRERSQVESFNVQHDMNDALEFLCRMTNLSNFIREQENTLPLYVEAEQYLRKQQGFRFPDTWINASRIKEEFRVLKEVVERKTNAVESSKKKLGDSVHTVLAKVEQQINEVEKKFRNANLDGADRKPVQTLQEVSQYLAEAERLAEELERTDKAQGALGNEPFQSLKLDGMLKDLKGLHSVWQHIVEIHAGLQTLGTQSFFEVSARQVQTDLQALEAKMDSFPTEERSFTPFVAMVNSLKEYMSYYKILQELRSDAMSPLDRAERHWVSLRSQLKKQWVLTSLTLADFWSSEPKKNGHVYQAVLDIAQGERRLNTQLHHISSYWEDHTLDVTLYQSKVLLVRGWDVLFEKLAEDIGTLTAMKLSPFYKSQHIISVATDWDKKLNNARLVLEVLLDVQRRWVYLDGIFSGSAEIRTQLPAEAQQFDKTTRDFISRMPNAKQSQKITALWFVAEDTFKTQFERIATQLSIIQRTLGEYLDTQRSRFPRFYFVGDEDLLEVIGNGKDPLLAAKHLRKMFSGVSGLTMKPGSNTVVDAVLSSEGERVVLHTPVDANGLPVYEWLNNLQQAVVASLRLSMSHSLAESSNATSSVEAYTKWLDAAPAQLVALATQIAWVADVEAQLKSSNKDLSVVEQRMLKLLDMLANLVLVPAIPASQRHKAEQIITLAVYQRNRTRRLFGVASVDDFEWLSCMRPYFKRNDKAEHESEVLCRMADAAFAYSFEYLGMKERLVQTSLTDRCYLTLTQALHTRLGGSPSGPAGTGKTETVKALGMQLGRFVLVFNCDESFDFKSMGRIFAGLCNVGAWGCFDEFNRLEERILSAVSQQIQSIQVGLRSKTSEITLDNKSIHVHDNLGIFITMNPGYAGRSNLPDNLKQLFRSVAMTTPDRENIAEVMLFAQGFQTAETMSKKIVPLFRLCNDQLSHQSHYDFGLRALKSVLISAGALKRGAVSRQESTSEADEVRLMLQSLTETVVPKLVAEDVDLFYPLLQDVFPGATRAEEPLEALHAAIARHSAAHGFAATPQWVGKMVQLYKILHVNHGIMLVGRSGCGKSSAWMTLLRALSELEDVDGHAYVIDPKAISKSDLYGVLEPTTREWKDGIFTATLRKIIDNMNGHEDLAKKRHWIILDGDVDPEWVENLNSLLDDNKLLTLPNGERLTLPSNVRVIFEVQNLRFATPATVSRCGMVWFSEDTIKPRHLLDRVVQQFRQVPITITTDLPISFVERPSVAEARKERQRDDGVDHSRTYTQEEERLLRIQQSVMTMAEEQFGPGGTVERMLHVFETQFSSHGIMEYNAAQSIRAMFTHFAQAARLILHHQDHNHNEVAPSTLKQFIQRRVQMAILWGFGSQLTVAKREEFAKEIHADIPSGGSASLMEYEVLLETGQWSEWKKRVGRAEISADKVGTNDVVIPTVDTTRHEDLISAWLKSEKPVILCGPPGSGKTMSLTAVLRASDDYEVVFLNFSSQTSPETIVKTLEQYCTVSSTVHGLVLSPNSGKRLIVFCDEINLPATDKYGTQRVIQFMRQLTERRGYYRSKDCQWVSLNRVQFAGACNPPTDPGRVPLTHRFLRWAPVLFVDFPSFESLQLIYETYCRAMFSKNIKLRAIVPNLTKAMVEFYKASQEHFTTDMQRHYVYSPRELSRWSRAIYEGIHSLDELAQRSVSMEEVVRLAVHEGLRIFRDRLTTEAEGQWTDNAIDSSFFSNFNGLPSSVLERPILFSTVFTRAYTSVSREDLRSKLRERLREFRDEAMEVELVVFDSMIDHVVRIDRVLQQPLGHMLLVGSSGVGKTILSRFVSWLNHLSVFQIKAHRGYTLAEFEDDLRGVMRRAGCKREKICFIFDESNIMDSNFLEYMNALLASGEVPGLFDGEENTKLMQAIREGLQGTNTVDSTNDQEIYKWFVSNVQQYLHVVFTMNPSSPDFHNRAATSPALFNRCTIDWFGDWDRNTTYHVAHELTRKIDVMFACGHRFTDGDEAHHALADCINRMHDTVNQINERSRKQNANRGTFITPRHLLDFIHHVHGMFLEKRTAVEDLQVHLQSGLSKLRDTSDEVDRQQKMLEEKEKDLAQRGKQAQEMLDRIVNEKEKANQRKAEATELKANLEKESARLSSDRVKVEHELSQAEPALKDAETALNTIKPEYLRELRAYATPPPMVKKVLEAVVILLGEKRASDWEVIKGYTRKDDFISQIKAFRPSNITDEARDKIKKSYLSDENFTYETALRASKAAGPLQKWVMAQIRYSDIFASVGPLRAEIDKLDVQFQLKVKQLEEAEKEIQTSEASITSLKDAFQVSTDNNSTIKKEISVVASRCNRANALMNNLLAEKTRWEDQSANFKEQTMCVLGDCLLSAGFLAYIGYYDERTRRQEILPEWRDVVDSCRIDFRRDMNLVEYLSRPEQRLHWVANKLPQDTLCVENAIILQKFNRYPLLIDPSGQAVQFLLNELKDKKITKTSFVEHGFMKQLENAVHFGYPILVQDVEKIDPVLNPLLNKEMRRVGGRQLVRLGAKDVDLSPSFMLYLSTRDSTFQFTPDVCGRVTMINFTVTQSSLQAQCLHHVMLHERPDVDEARSDLMKLQGEYKAKLRTLEDQLLTAIAESEGNILENEKLIDTLETLKKQSREVEEKIASSEESFQKIVEVEERYTPLANLASKLYFSFHSLREMNVMYLFSLNFFFGLLEASLRNLPEKANRDDRIPVIVRQLLVAAHVRLTRSMFQRDHVSLGLRLAQLRSLLKDTVGSHATTQEWELVFQSSSSADEAGQQQPHNIPRSIKDSYSGLTSAQSQGLKAVLATSTFLAIQASLENPSNHNSWISYFTTTANPLEFIPNDAFGATANLTPARRTFLSMLLTKYLRRDAFTAACGVYLRALFDADPSTGSLLSAEVPKFLNDTPMTLHDMLPELSCSRPLLIVSAAGYDATNRVEELAASSNRALNTVAMGSPEGYDEAEIYLSRCMKNGGWVLLKNVHLASQFLADLEKRIHSENLENRVHSQFRLFLSSEQSPNIPATLLLASLVCVVEPPPGMKASMIRTIGTMSEASIPQYPKELPRLYFAASWLHAVLTERMNYVPLGWSKRYEFSEADFRRAIGTIDSWVQRVRGERHNVSPSEMPWNAIRQLISESVYGGKVDNEFDDALLATFCEGSLCDKIYQAQFSYVDGEHLNLDGPQATLRDIQDWIQRLPDVQPPQWLGLPASATTMVLTQRADRSMDNLARIQTVFDDEEQQNGDEANRSFAAKPTKSGQHHQHGTHTGGAAARWASRLSVKITDWIAVLSNAPTEKLAASTSTSNNNSPFAVALGREAQVAKSLQQTVLRDLKEILEICQGTRRTTNSHRELVDTLLKEQIPARWKKYAVPAAMVLSQWVADFAVRIGHINTVVGSEQTRAANDPRRVPLGFLLFPEAMLTATRQTAARALKWSLEGLSIRIELLGPNAAPPAAQDGVLNEQYTDILFASVQGVQLRDGVCVPLQAGNDKSEKTFVPTLRLSWVKEEGGAVAGVRRIRVPLYLNDQRTETLAVVQLPVSEEEPVRRWVQRGVCLTAWGAQE